MDDSELLTRFEDRSLPFADWTHRTHVKVAYLMLRDASLEAALERLCKGIKAYNAANGVPEGLQQGYHETMTRAFLVLIDATMRVHGERLPTPDAESFCDTHPQLLCKQVLRLFYSNERWSSPEAKGRFVQPDLAPLPRPRGEKRVSTPRGESRQASRTTVRCA